ncbi:hypothetical protein [Leptospira yasudae]|uniref:Uncharacterized protein n=1 Tax=Leptospira yasudae TaxID=2202201 RepID=A0A6N4QJU4_9LEPT|nr:hypothetical protein [Leptospira yasudae]TGL82628.1 hypothetical protein EHQ72_03765 [Leptospira yasudae]TGL83727.1 hypothetical protein EHQ77_01365 [Leptospira yasudae]TGL84650.1 hypothetical protein EHQ83_10475 [Leptospira yasudae]
MKGFVWKWITVLAIGFELLSCKPEEKKFDALTFYDNITSDGGLRLFNLLDDYPSLKAGFQSLQPEQFNLRLDSSMRRPARKDITGFLRVSSDMFLKPEARVRESLLKANTLIHRLKEAPSGAFEGVLPWLERIRKYPGKVVRNLSPISQAALIYLYNTFNASETEIKYRELANALKDPDMIELFQDLETVLHKALVLNANARSGVESILQGMIDPTLSGDRVLKTQMINLIAEVGNAFQQRAGFSDFKSSDTALKDLIVNLEKYYTPGGSVHDSPGISDYRDANYPSDFSIVMTEAFRYLRPMLGAGGTYTKNPNVLLGKELSKNLFNLGFPTEAENVDFSLRELIRLDYLGRDRAYGGFEYKISALEQLLFLLTLADTYGFRWENPSDNTIMSLEPNGSVNGGPMTNGVLTVGDSIYALGSAMTGNLGVKAFLNQSANDGAVYRNGDTTTPTPFTMGINTPTLALLESPDPSVVPAANDPVFTKTIPFMMKLIVNVVLSGGGPYYNKNRRDEAGNIYTIDGKPYIDSNGNDLIYKSSWSSSDYRIKVSDTGSGTCTAGSLCRWVGPGGRESNASYLNNQFTQVASGVNASGTKGWSIPIWEIAKTSGERALETDEEVLYKNFQWLLSEKRMVAVIPLRASLGPGVPYKMAAFVTVIANGLKGLMGAKPQFQDGSSCASKQNGKWNILGSLWKPGCASSTQPNFRVAGTQVLEENFSSLPGDSMFFLEAWDYGTSGTSSITFNSLGDSNVYNIFYPPSSQYGVLPPVFAFNFPVMERLSFLTADAVSPSQVNSYWDKRNKLLPLIVSLAKTLTDQSDSATNKNPFQLLTGLSAALTRPLLTQTTDLETNSGGRTITVVKTALPNGKFRNRFAGPEEYLFRQSDPITEEPIRSPLSVLIEKERGFQDGLLNLVSKTKLLTHLVHMLAEMGRPSRQPGADLFFAGLAAVAGEIKLTSETPTSVQFNLQTYLEKLGTDLAAYPDSRPANVYDPLWDDMGVVAVRLRDYLSRDSVYSLIPMFDFSMDLVLDVTPSPTEIVHLLNLLGSIFQNSSGNRDYLLTSLLTSDTPALIEVSAVYGRCVNGVLMGLSLTGEFFSYLEADMNTPYTIREIFDDLDRLTVSDMMQSRSGNRSLLYTAGVLMNLFADITEKGRKPFPDGTVFWDRFNKNEDSTTYWDNLTSIFSR